MNDEFPTLGLVLAFAALALIFWVTERYQEPWNPHGTTTTDSSQR